MGFPDEAISMALDRTLVKTGKLNWKYMDAILQSWHQKGLHQPGEIEEKDSFGRKAAPVRPAKKDKPVSIEDIKGLVGKI